MVCNNISVSSFRLVLPDYFLCSLASFQPLGIMQQLHCQEIRDRDMLIAQLRAELED